MNYLFVINPSAGQRKANKIKQILEGKISNNKKYRDKKHSFIIPETVYELEEKLKLKIEKEKTTTIVAVGGDGTVATVIRNLIDYENINIGIIPQGTGNILASNLGILSEIDSSLETVFFGKEERIDIGQVDKNPFTIMAGTGVPARIIENIKKEDKAMFGIWAYFIKGLEYLYSAKEFDFKINIDGRDIQTKSIAVLVSNAGNFFGPFIKLTSNAKPTDEFLDVFILSIKSLKENPVEYFELIVNYLTGNVKGQEKKLRTFKAKEIIIDSTPKLKVQADGDIVSTTPTKIKILPLKQKILIPNKPVILTPSVSDIMSKIEEMFNIKLPR